MSEKGDEDSSMKYKLNEANIDAVCKEADAFLIQKKNGTQGSDAHEAFD